MLASVPRLDALVCNAGIGIFGSVEEVPIEAAREQFETNVFGTLRVLRAVLPHLREARRGRIVIVGSLAGRAPIPFQAHYSASKAALDALALALHNELHATGVAGLAGRAGRHPHRVQRAHRSGASRRARSTASGCGARSR